MKLACRAALVAAAVVAAATPRLSAAPQASQSTTSQQPPTQQPTTTTPQSSTTQQPTSPPETPQYEETVDVVSRTPQKIADAPATVTVIGARAIEQSTSPNFAELLRRVLARVVDADA